MPHINNTAREVTCKLVYYGPGLCGKTTNVKHIHQRVDPGSRGRLVSMATEGERTLFFDWMPVNAGQVKGYTLKFQLFTVPGQVYYNTSRRKVLTGADGIVFVADSQQSRFEANLESLQNLYDNLRELGMDPDAIPLIFQYNKRDCPHVMPVEQLQEALNFDDVPAFEAVAHLGVGVFETLGELMARVEANLLVKL